MRMKPALCVVLTLVVVSRSVSGYESAEFIRCATISEWNWRVPTEFSPTRGVDHFAFVDGLRVAAWDKADSAVEVLSAETFQSLSSFPLTYERQLATGYRMSADGEIVAIQNNESAVIICDIASGHHLELAPWDYGFEASYSRFRYTINGGFLIYEEPRQRRFHSFQIIDTPDGLDVVYRNAADTRAFIEATYRGNAGFYYDSDGYLFYGERLVTANPLTFNGYFSRFDWYTPAEGMMETRDTRLLGVDAAGNYYWVNPVFLAVYDPSGRLIEAMRFDLVPEMGRLQIDPYGNIYVLSYGGVTPGQLDLLWIQNDWATITDEQVASWAAGIPPAPPFAPDATVVIPSSAGSWGIRRPPAVVIRTEPEANADEVAAVPVNTRVRVLDRTTDITQIGILRAPWYLIETEDGTTGWILGSFLERD